MKKLFFLVVLFICFVQPSDANKWRYFLPPLAKSLRHINDQPKVSYSTQTASGSDDDNPWNYIMPCILIVGVGYLVWPLVKEANSSSSATPPRYYQSIPRPKNEPIILANHGGVLIR